jgi:hypothetical protein
MAGVAPNPGWGGQTESRPARRPGSYRPGNWPDSRCVTEERLYASTLIIITAKHGDGPIDPQRLRLANLDWIPSVVKKIDPGLLLNVEQNGSIAMVWLRNHEHTEDVAASLRRSQLEEGIQQVLSGTSLKLLFNDPANDPACRHYHPA